MAKYYDEDGWIDCSRVAPDMERNVWLLTSKGIRIGYLDRNMKYYDFQQEWLKDTLVLAWQPFKKIREVEV